MQQTPTPTEVEETTLDDISGGPHFRNFHVGPLDYQAMPELDANTQSSGHYTQMAWAKTR